MKRIIDLSCSGVLLFTSMFAHAEKTVKFYETQGADAALVKADDKYTLTLSGGAPPAGASTSADCYVKSKDLELKNGILGGELAPIHNGIANLSSKNLTGHHIYASLNNSIIDVREADVQGICADDIDLTGGYKVVVNENEIKEKYIYYVDMAHQEALLFLKSGNPVGAVTTLAPYANSYRERWLRDRSSRNTLISVLNDYAYALQLNNQNEEAITILRAVLSAAPNRAVAWLNIADSYWSQGDFEKGRAAYRKYVSLMTSAGDATKILPRANERYVN
ncbi:TPA: tetratricopeptide repeat protein [Burkholderia aenigmatica]|uniref:tetratricopeptide repeat protein n=1 Tax=Burkholderia sp. AU45251 TaxID=3059204 RepID=UPI0026543000|nr:tetratricopeptide repeat protein [Burkholderia sp. AU45251]HDR9481190.1 tetratricopeptide repeat protein [Burkholderia aenigmatica]MDN7514190.1 tetratricopeptide repeat protein [Burkholderia sp. AU45251]HDR9512716.1 tetratricopeptide repeat protein [Burkholderia aenigmatica]HDR9592985.1 tetratricopeptide repeat protein [Burkholderia aenigmatica]HDR9601111.1 tetratricopeptide repeat protein [Burkholderia aenigmatica]